MGRHKINEEDRVQGMMINLKGFILDNINNDLNAMNEIYAFIESKWGEKDVEKYDKQRKEKRIEWLQRNLEDSKNRLTELETKYVINSDLYKMMSPAVIKKIAEFENELSLINEAL
ncbi:MULTISPECIES: hypothetical protein [Paenibacillus]|uniref:hypothetical protein n=1 Tax=Paenibacillus TaxID=44249 RepID=UPI00096FBBD8|nr:hypothetical protein [Paenibacillus odorifer]OMD74161.1 hypothetical protein BSK50_21275 [Paenibacillus odorifer]